MPVPCSARERLKYKSRVEEEKEEGSIRKGCWLWDSALLTYLELKRHARYSLTTRSSLLIVSWPIRRKCIHVRIAFLGSASVGNLRVVRGKNLAPGSTRTMPQIQ